jgi:quinol monooxygenase YgiN
MTVYEALWTVKAQLQKNEQNLKAIEVLEGVVKGVYEIYTDDTEKTYTLSEVWDEMFGTEAQHIRNHMQKVYEKDLQHMKDTEEGK